MKLYTYIAYGLNFASSIPIPELVPHNISTPDVIIGYGKVPCELPFPSAHGAAWQSEPGKLLLPVSEIARYLIIDNREIIIEPLPGSTEKDIRIFLLGSVLGALLHARQMLVLHSSVIETERGAVLFMGTSGAGKSTLLAAFTKRGYAMLADDKAGISVNDKGIAQTLPAFPFARMTIETVNELKIPVEGLQINCGLGKYVVPVERFCDKQLDVYAAYSMNVHNRNEIVIEPLLERIEKFERLNRHTYRRRFLYHLEQKQAHFEILSKLSDQTRVINVIRPDDPQRIEELADRIEEDFNR